MELALADILITLSTVVVAVKVSMNGIHKRLESHGRQIKAIGEDVTNVKERIARIEGKME